MTTWAETGDERLLAWENAAELSEMLNTALTGYQIEDVLGRTPSLDAIGFIIPSESDVVLGERGKRHERGVAFTYRQTITMAETLGALLPELASQAHQAAEEHKAKTPPA